MSTERGCRPASPRLRAPAAALLAAIGCTATNPDFERAARPDADASARETDGPVANGQPTDRLDAAPRDAGVPARDAPVGGEDARAVDAQPGSERPDAAALDSDAAPEAGGIRTDAAADAGVPRADAAPEVAPPAPDAPPGPPGLIARYTFEEGEPSRTTADVSGNGNVIALRCSSDCINGHPEWITGRVGLGVLFTFYRLGEIQASSSMNRLRGAFTITAWLHRSPAINTDDRSILGREVDSRNGTQFFRLAFLSGRLKATVGATSVVDTLVVPANSWVHVALRFDGATLSLHRNGMRVVHAAAAAPPAPSATTTFVGTAESGGSYTYFADATFDDLRFYEGALSDAAIMQLAQ